jgi:hypothetical protein
VLSVTGRVLITGVARRQGMTTVTAVVFAVQAVGAVALPHLGHTTAGAIACVIAFGLGFGVATIAKPAIVADRYGTARYATISATMTVPITIVRAAAPLAAAALTTSVSFTLAGLACLASAILLWSTRERAHPAFMRTSPERYAD